MNDATNHLTPEELELLRLFRKLDAQGQHRVLLAAKSVKVSAEQRNRNPFA